MRSFVNVGKKIGVFGLISVCVCNAMFAAPFKRVVSKPSEPKEITKKSKTGFMLGADFGIKTITIQQDSDRFIMDFGLSLGYILYFHNSFGMRIKGDYHYAFMDLVSADKLNPTNSYATNLHADDSHEFLFNIDFLYDFYNNNEQGLSLGIFAGLGAGYLMQTTQRPLITQNAGNSYSNVNRSGFEVMLNAGFTTIFHSKHRLDLTYRYAVLTPRFEGDIITNIAGGNPTISGNISVPVSIPFVFNLGYSYVF